MKVNGKIIRGWLRRNCFKEKKGVIFIALCVLMLSAFFLCFIHPWFSVLLIPPLGEHDGLKHYTSQQYLRYENGELFEQYLMALDFIPGAKAVDFYHVDHWVRDNPFYGKYCDFFSVDFKLDEDNYSTTKSALVQSGNYFHDCQMDDFDLWLREDLPNIFLIAFCDEQMVIRCILATDCDSAQGVAGGLIRHTSLEWQVK